MKEGPKRFISFVMLIESQDVCDTLMTKVV